MISRRFPRPFVLALSAAFLAASLAPAADALHEFTQPHMGTQFRIIVHSDGANAESAKKAAAAAFERIRQLDLIMSDYKPDSELMRLCQQAGGPPVKVSAELFDVLSKSQALAAQSEGAFDVTAGPIIQLWRRARRRHELPDPERLAHARTLSGHCNLKLVPQSRSVELLKEGMRLDLGGIAKGYAADQALAVLKSAGFNRALVAAGGDIAAGEAPPGEPGWRIAIAPLEVPGSEFRVPSSSTTMPLTRNSEPGTRNLTVLLLRNQAVSTSGDAEQHVEIAGTRYSHIIDPRTGQALTGRANVTVVAPTCTQSDGLATALSVLGPEQGCALAGSIDGAAALFVIAQENGTGERVVESLRWKAIPRAGPR